MASSLLAVLTAEEFQNVDEPVRKKLEDFLKKNDEDCDRLKFQITKLQTESEQRCFELDQQLQQLQEQGQKEESIVTELTERKTLLEGEVASLRGKLESLETKAALLENTSQETKREKENAVREKEDMSALLSRRNEDLDRLTAELRALTDQLVHANKEKSEALVKTEELNSKQLALDYKEKRMDQERELLVRQQRMLQDQLDSRTKELMNIRREKTSQVLELQADVAEKIEELRVAQKTIGEMKSTCELQEKHIKELNDRLKELSETEMKMSENNRNELRSQMRLCELYKASSEEAQAKADELTKATEELQRLLRDASARYGELETESKARVDYLKEQLEKCNEANEELKKELERANTLIDASKSRTLTESTIEAMSPSAAAASRLLKSGMTLTQIYSQYVSVSEQLLVKEEENRRLNNYIDQILQEIEDRAPTMARQRADYEKSVEMVANLTRQLDLAVEETEAEKEKALEARRLLGQVERTNQRLEKQVADLGKQVCFLVREVEELRGNRMRDDVTLEEEDQRVSSSEGSASVIISRHLVTFRDVEELQQRNQMLLNTLREVTEKQDEAEKEAIDAKTAKIQQALENALAELEHHRDTRRRHEELMESVIQQRDMYRILLQEAGLSESRSPTKFRDIITSTPAAKKDDLRPVDFEKKCNDLKTQLEQLEVSYQSLIRDKKDVEKTSSEKVQALQDLISDLRSQNARLGTQSQYAEEKEKLLQGNLDSYKKQLNSLEEKNKMYACTVAKHEQSIAILRDEAMNAQQQLARAEVTISMLQEEKQLLKDAERRLLIERDSLLNERRTQSMLHVNLESIKLNLERAENETRVRLQNNITSLEQQIELLQKKLVVEEQRYKEAVSSFEERIEADKALLKAAENRAVDAEAQLAVAKESLATAESRQRVTSPLRKAQATRLLLTSPPSTAESDVISDLRAQLAEARSDATNNRDQLELIRQQAEQYRSIADSMEEELKKSNETSLALKQEMERQLLKLTGERNALAGSLQTAEDELKRLQEGTALRGQESAHQSEEISLRISQLEAEVNSLTARLKCAEESEAKARQDFLEQANQTKEAQEKYERELMQHASDVEQLNAVREQIAQSQSRFAAVQQALARVEEELRNGRASWDEQKRMLETDLTEKSRRCSELDKQVDVMQQQIVTLSARMAAATRVQEMAVKSQGGDDAKSSLNVSIGEEESRSSDQLLELVRFLRREKEIAISRFEIMEAEAQRTKTQLEQCLRQLSEAQAALHEERERSSTVSLTAEKHTEMMRKLETLNALTDSNRLLRDERSNLQVRVDELAAKVAAMEAEVEPLRASNQESSSRLEEMSAENQTLRTQVETWRKRTSALQERAGRAAADDVKRLQTEKEQVQKQLEQLQKQLEQAKDVQSKSTALLTETQRTNTQLVMAQQKLQEEARKAKEDAQRLQSELSAAEAKQTEDAAKNIEQTNQLRRIARKYKSQYEELKAEHDRIVQEHEKLAGERTAAATASTSTESTATPKEEGTAQAEAVNTAQTARLQELEERLAQLSTELEQVKTENQSLRANDEKAKALLKTLRQKLANMTTLTKEKEAQAAELAEARAKNESYEQVIEEANVRSAALRSQLEGRIARLERENAELAQAKQAVESEFETLNHRLPILQRQIEAYQKQLAIQQQQQSQQTPPQAATKAQSGADKVAPENPPTANIKPMASGSAVATQRPPVSSSPGQSASGPASSQMLHRTTPTASIRPMAMQSRTVAVQPTSVSVSPMTATPPVAIATPTLQVRDEGQPVAGPSGISTGADAAGASSSGPAAADERSKKRTRASEAGDSTVDSAGVKRTRLNLPSEEESVEIVAPSGPEGITELAPEDFRPTDSELAADYEEQQDVVPAEEGEEEQEAVAEGEEGLIESDGDEPVESGDVEDQVEEEDEIVIEVEDQREEGEDFNAEQNLSSAVPEATDEEEPVPVSMEVQSASALGVEEQQQVPIEPEEQQQQGQGVEEVMESEAFAPSAAPSAGGAGAMVGIASIRPPHPREDRLPSFGRSTGLTYEDGGDDGIVPSTPVLLRPRANDGFAEAVSSPANAHTRFVFGAGTDLSVVSNAPSSGLESQGIDDTRMDLSQLEEANSVSRSVPYTPLEVSPNDEVVPAPSLVSRPVEEVAVVPAAVTEEQADLEGGPDMEGDAAAEFDLLAEEDSDSRTEQPSVLPASTVVEQEQDSLAPLMPTDDIDTTETPVETSGQQSEAPQLPVSAVPALIPITRPPLSTRRGIGSTGLTRGRGSPNVSRPVPITWTPSSPSHPVTQPVYRENPSRVFRRAPANIVSMGAPPAALGVQGSPAGVADVVPAGAVGSVGSHSPVRGRGLMRGRSRPRGGRRM